MTEEEKDRIFKTVKFLAEQMDNLSLQVKILAEVLLFHKKKLAKIEKEGLPIKKIIERAMISLN